MSWANLSITIFKPIKNVFIYRLHHDTDEKINFEHVSLDNYDVPIESEDNSDAVVSNRSSPSNSHIKKIQDHINEKFHEAALDHLKKK